MTYTSKMLEDGWLWQNLFFLSASSFEIKAQCWAKIPYNKGLSGQIKSANNPQWLHCVRKMTAIKAALPDKAPEANKGLEQWGSGIRLLFAHSLWSRCQTNGDTSLAHWPRRVQAHWTSRLIKSGVSCCPRDKQEPSERTSAGGLSESWWLRWRINTGLPGGAPNKTLHMRSRGYRVLHFCLPHHRKASLKLREKKELKRPSFPFSMEPAEQCHLHWHL